MPGDALRHAQLEGSASGLVGKMRRPPSPEVAQACRRMWPELFERLDDLAELVEARDAGWADRTRPGPSG